MVPKTTVLNNYREDFCLVVAFAFVMNVKIERVEFLLLLFFLHFFLMFCV